MQFTKHGESQRKPTSEAHGERMRQLATISIQPHVKRKMKPQTLLPLPWDNQPSNGSRNEVELTMEQKKERFEELINQK